MQTSLKSRAAQVSAMVAISLILTLANEGRLLAASAVDDWAANVEVPPETSAQSNTRHEKVKARRGQVQIICHRGAWEFAHENTLEAYRATFELGADGNEIDIRATKDGVLVCFHDDMLDHLLEAYGDVADYNWNELQQFRFRDPGPFGKHCRIPTLVEVFELHRRHGGLLHLDIKRPGLDRGIVTLLNRMDMWDQIVVAPGGELGDAIVKDSRLHRGQFKASMYEDHSELFPETIAEALAKPGDMLMVEDPRGVLFTLHRTISRPSTEPVAPLSNANDRSHEESSAQSVESLIARLRDAADWNIVPTSPDEEAKLAARILDRARAADSAGQVAHPTPELIAALEDRVRNRSLHPNWRYHGLDGASALRALFELKSDRAVPLARFCMLRDDPDLAKVQNPMWKTPRSWVDFRVKFIVFRLLRDYRPEGTAEVCREYLALPEQRARELSPVVYDDAARALLTASPNQATAVELLQNPRRDVRGRAILFCLKQIQQPWAEAALKAAAPFAMNYAFR